MPTRTPRAMTGLVDQARQGDAAALNRLLPEVYAELRRIAARHMRRERPGQTIQATALVHEAYLRLFKDTALSFQNRAHFLAIAAHSMREILVERARARNAAKRGGGRNRITLNEALMGSDESSVDCLAVHEALAKFSAIAPQPARIVELRFFGGLTTEEIAEAVGVSPATVKRHWSVARAWLYRELRGR
ncbi:MAG: sigma-70 family RNA polymerase sigma factor [Acidobacteria bacterium]|nr:sigma-70 family RNA polymerase sigma factor [Acidobacteriota bacterium]